MNFERIKLGTLCALITKGTTPTTIGHKFTDSGVAFVKVESLTEDGQIDTDKLAYIDLTAHEALKRSQLASGDILFTIAGTIGRVGKVPDAILPANTNQAVALIRPNPEALDGDFLLYSLRQLVNEGKVASGVVQAVQANFSLGNIRELELYLPGSTEDQKKVVGALRLIDAKINVSRRINQTLEAMAQAIFKSWFVDFDPVKAKIAAKAEGRDPLRAAMSAISGKTDAELDVLPSDQLAQLAATAALFPDEMEESALGEIPKGWYVSNLGEQCAYLNRGISPKYIGEGGVLVLNQKCIRDFSLDPSKGRRHDPNQRNVSGRELQPGDVLVNSTGVGTLGRVAQVLWLDEPTIVDSHVTVARAGSKLNSAYLGQWFVAKQPEIEAMGEGSTGQTELSRVKLASMPITLPPSAVLGAFAAVLSPLQSLIANRYRESLMLQETRDALLPRLLSGELQPTVALEGVEG